MTVSSTATQGKPLAEVFLSPRDISDRYDRVAFSFTHSLHNHPLASFPALIELARQLQKLEGNYTHVRQAVVPLTQSIDLGPNEPVMDIAADEAMKNIESLGAYVHLKSVHVIPEYARLRDELLGPIEAQLAGIDPGMTFKVMSFFIAAPGSVTPYHMDRELNFLCQISGHKRLHTWDARDRTVMSEMALEKLFARRDLRRPEYDERYESAKKVFQLEPGVGVHIPFTAPHYAMVENKISIAAAVTFHTAGSDRRAGAYEANYYLRRLGLKPAAPGSGAIVDQFKHRSARIVRRVKRYLR